MAKKKFRTAVLVVHGIGSQRAQETVNGVVNAIWFDKDDHDEDRDKRIWTHPEPSGIDLDLSVMTTNGLDTATGKRSIDFHELYWAHLMSETKAVAVLLWLFELGRKGPHFRPGMNGLWYIGAVFLCLLGLSVSLLALDAITWLTGSADALDRLIYVPVVMLMVGVIAGLIAGVLTGALRVIFWSAAVLVLCAGGYFLIQYLLNHFGVTIDQAGAIWWVKTLLPAVAALAAARLVMGNWGLLAFGIAYGLSWLFYFVYFELLRKGWLPAGLLEVKADAACGPWSLCSKPSLIAAWLFIGVYAVVNAGFLQPYLGDAARYFRNAPANVAVRREIRKQAVDILDSLHASAFYDRIIVVAHSLGSVVAYDMLRAYYSRICDRIPISDRLEPEFSQINKGGLSRQGMRNRGRRLIRKIAELVQERERNPESVRGRTTGFDLRSKAWLVTDFVTIGNALTHAKYLACAGKNAAELEEDFEQKVTEREFPVCPPVFSKPDGWIAFKYPRSDKMQMHHGGLFAMTRWTNLYFPRRQLFWGDAIGGPVGAGPKGDEVPVFGRHIADVEVWTDRPGQAGFFTHTKYWNTSCPKGRKAPHIKALRAAVNLEDEFEPEPKKRRRS